jgi:3-oxoadipate enol-lactonase/4-carboxymuconolactone decarboxylase
MPSLDDRRRRARGLRTRRTVLGAAHVAGAIRATTAFDREFQDLITRYVWGEIWTRPGLPRRTRRLITLATLVALNRPEELRLHVRAALTDGVGPATLKEVFLQAAVYCGVPAARGAFEVAREVLGAPAVRGARRRVRRGRSAKVVSRRRR